VAYKKPDKNKKSAGVCTAEEIYGLLSVDIQQSMICCGVSAGTQRNAAAALSSPARCSKHSRATTNKSPSTHRRTHARTAQFAHSSTPQLRSAQLSTMSTLGLPLAAAENRHRARPAVPRLSGLLLIHKTGQTRSHETSTVRLDRPPCNLTLITLVGLLQSRGPW